MDVPDARRATGARTRERLLAAARHLIAEGDGGEVTLRSITDAAGANVAAVKYHFGSKDQLRDAVVTQGLRDVVDVQLERYAALPPDAGLDELAAALVEPVVDGLAAADADGRALLRIAARAATAELGSREAAELARGTEELLRRLAPLMPEVGPWALRVRAEAVSAVLRSYAIGPLGTLLADMGPAATTQILVPIVVGAWRGA